MALRYSEYSAADGLRWPWLGVYQGNPWGALPPANANPKSSYWSEELQQL